MEAAAPSTEALLEQQLLVPMTTIPHINYRQQFLTTG